MPTAFTPEAVREWFSDDVPERLAALERFTAATPPTADQELWRYSRIGELDLGAYGLEREDHLQSDVIGDDGVRGAGAIGPAPAELDQFGELNRAFSRPIVIRVPANTVIEEPILVNHVGEASGVAYFPRLVIEAGENSEVTVVETFWSDDSDRTLFVPVVDVRAHQASRVRYLAINDLGYATWMIANQQAAVHRDASLLLSSLALGGDYARVRTHVRALGQGSTTKQVALYFADREQTHDFRVTQEHIAPKTYSDLLFKGAVANKAHSVYTGLIKIGPDALGTQAFQTNRNLTLSEGTWAESVPNLEIETNDVKCSHASTVGPIDEDQRFYLESRGIEPDVAQRLVVLGFFDEVLDQLPVGATAGELRTRVETKLRESVES